MHIEAFEGMKALYAEFGKGRTLDVGSLQVRSNHHTFREFCSDYVGTDLVAGPNVNIVCTEVLPFPDSSFDAVLSGNCFEHCENPFALMAECARVLKPGGYFLVVAPREWPEHNRPDCWRFLPDGWRALLKYAKLECVRAWVSEPRGNARDSWAVGKKT